MADLTTYARFRDWLTLAVVAGIISLAGIIYTSDRGRLTKLEAIQEEKGDRLASLVARVATLEAARVTEREDVLRRLDRIETKIDKLNP